MHLCHDTHKELFRTTCNTCLDMYICKENYVDVICNVGYKILNSFYITNIIIIVLLIL